MAARGYAAASAQVGDQPVLFVESAVGGFGDELVTDLVALIPPGQSITSFEVTVQFDPANVTYKRIVWPTEFPVGSATVDADGILVISSSGGRGCFAASSCHFATLVWEGKQPGESAIRVVDVTARDGSGSIPIFGSVDGYARVVSSQADPFQRDSQLGLWNGLMLVGLVLLLCGGLAVPLLLAIGRLPGRNEHREQRREPHSTEELAQFVNRYLDNVDVAGSVDGPLSDVEVMAQATALEDR